MNTNRDISAILTDLQKGDKDALDKLVSMVYEDLRSIAKHCMKQERSNHTLQATALINEVYLQLAKETHFEWKDKAHFFALIGRMMRRILVNYAVAKRTDKRGGSLFKVSLQDISTVAEAQDWDIIALNEALERLAVMDERKSRIVELRFFSGLENEEIAEIMGMSLATVNRDLRFAKAWLQNEIVGNR
ncbi:MAG: sigma-70 family RNA polymerase sigma factor [Blastocatellia bacterium]|nr:sigma-70 family RNA polymerase sigma factor [Blastocatellia bacterium]